MRGLLILSLACLALVSAADKKDKKRSYGFGIDTADIVPAVQYQTPFSSIDSVSHPSAYSTDSVSSLSTYPSQISTDSVSTVGLSSYPSIASASYYPGIYSNLGVSSYPTRYSAPISTIGSSSYSTGYSAPISTIGSSSYPTGYSAPISTIGSSVYPTTYSAPQSYAKGYNVINKAVPVYVPKPVPYEVTKTVQVPTPYTVTVAKPYSVPVKVNVPVEIPKPYEVKVEHRVPVPVPERVPIEIPRPYPVYKTKEVRVEIEKPVYVKEKVEVRIPVPKPYPVEVPTAVRVKVPQNVYLKDPQFVESAVDTYGRAYGVPNYVYGNSFQNLNVPYYQSEKTISASLPESKSLEDSISANIQEQGNFGKSLSQLSEQSIISSQSGYDQAVQDLGNQAFDSSSLLQSNFGTDFSQGLPQALEPSVNGLPSYEEYRKLHQADGVVNEEKESVSVEAKSSATQDSDKSLFEERSGKDEPIVSDAASTPASPAESEASSSEEYNSEESTVPSKTTDIL